MQKGSKQSPEAIEKMKRIHKEKWDLVRKVKQLELDKKVDLFEEWLKTHYYEP